MCGQWLDYNYMVCGQWLAYNYMWMTRTCQIKWLCVDVLVCLLLQVGWQWGFDWISMTSCTCSDGDANDTAAVTGQGKISIDPLHHPFQGLHQTGKTSIDP